MSSKGLVICIIPELKKTKCLYLHQQTYAGSVSFKLGLDGYSVIYKNKIYQSGWILRLKNLVTTIIVTKIPIWNFAEKPDYRLTFSQARDPSLTLRDIIEVMHRNRHGWLGYLNNQPIAFYNRKTEGLVWDLDTKMVDLESDEKWDKDHPGELITLPIPRIPSQVVYEHYYGKIGDRSVNDN